MKKILLLLLCATLLFCLIACGSDTQPSACLSHFDNDGDGKCDSCGGDVKTPTEECTVHTDDDGDQKCDSCGAFVPKQKLNIKLIENGQANFKFVLAKNGVSADLRAAVLEVIDAFSDIGIDVEMVNESETNVSNCEILIGNVTTRGEKYAYDGYSLGKEGYAFVGIDEKIIINAGSLNSLNFAFEIFLEDVLGFVDGEVTNEDSVTFSESVIEKQTGYDITSISICGEDIKGYSIAIDKKDSDYSASARSLQDTIYTYAGYYLPIVNIGESEKAIIIENVTDAGEDGFRITTTDSGALHIECAYKNMLTSAMDKFILEEFKLKNGALDFGKDYVKTEPISTITYEMFGAKGDGRTDDFEALYNAHVTANEGGQTVVAKKGATYYLKDITKPIPISTNVIWEDASITIDDRDLLYGQGYTNAVFYISNPHSKMTFEYDEVKKFFPERTIDKDNLTINWDYDFSAIVMIYNVNHKNYIRYRGPDKVGEGATQQELISVNENGEISELTPLLFDYEDVTGVTIIRTDVEPITIKGGKITTLASQRPKEADANYLGRSMSISRPNTILSGVEHYVLNELDKDRAHPCTGFFSITNSENVLLENCVLTARTGNGSYDLSLSYSNNLILKNCTQSNFFKADGVTPSMHGNEYWGVMGSNYCKNVTYDTCVLSRFDAHQGIYNATIKDSTINAIEVIGGGTFLVENTTFYLSRALMFDLRTDYGSTFKGDIIIRNCHVINYDYDNTNILKANWANVYFGYTCCMPNLTIDGLTFDKVEGDVNIITVYAIFDGIDYKYDTINGNFLYETAEINKNPYQPFEYVRVLNNTAGYRYTLFNAPYFQKVILEGVVRV